jgi:hypothetical protein
LIKLIILKKILQNHYIYIKNYGCVKLLFLTIIYIESILKNTITFKLYYFLNIYFFMTLSRWTKTSTDLSLFLRKKSTNEAPHTSDPPQTYYVLGMLMWLGRSIWWNRSWSRNCTRRHLTHRLSELIYPQTENQMVGTSSLISHFLVTRIRGI